MIELLVEVVNYSSVVDLLQFHVRIQEVIIHSLRLPLPRLVIILFEFFRVDDAAEAEDDPFLVLLLLLRQGLSPEVAQPCGDTVPIGHVDQVDELFPVVLNVEVKEPHEETMGSQDAGTYTNFAAISLGVLELSFLLVDS